jgi:glycosyltransferase involved in cell wall biosynthesis
VELQVSFTARGVRGVQEAYAFARAHRHFDVVILPYTRWNIWSPTSSRILQLALVYLVLWRRTVTVLHDVYRPGSPRRLEWWVLLLVLSLSGRSVVHSERERIQLGAVPFAGRTWLVPHFVVERSHRERARARARLGVNERATVLGMVGWMNPRKNYELAIEALALLPESFELWLIGGVGLGLDDYAASLQELFRERGLRSRVLVTGTVSEEELELRLAALDVGLCPYHRISASGSVSTVIGARRPVIVSDVEFARELRALAPIAVHTLPRLDAQALAETIARVVDLAPQDTDFDAILHERSVFVTGARYLALARSLSRPRTPHRNGNDATASRS